MGPRKLEIEVIMQKYLFTALLALVLASSFGQAKKDSLAIINLLEKKRQLGVLAI